MVDTKCAIRDNSLGKDTCFVAAAVVILFPYIYIYKQMNLELGQKVPAKEFIVMITS